MPVFSLLSERHDSNFIAFWLLEWLRFGGSVPKEFTCDMSLALLNAASRAFANCSSLDSYIETLFKYHFTSSASKVIPNCYIRIDIAHLIHNVAACDALHNVRPKVKEFFVRCVAELVKETGITMAERHIRNVLIVALSNTEGLCIFHISILILIDLNQIILIDFFNT